MKAIGSHIYIGFSELTGYGVLEITIKKGMARGQKNLGSDVPNGNSWHAIPDPADRRRRLIRLDTIPARTRTKYAIPTEQEAREMLAAEAQTRDEHKRQIAEQERYAAIRQAVDEGYASWMPAYTSEGYMNDTARQLAKAAAAAEVALGRVFAGERADHKEAEALLPIVQAERLRYLKLKNKRYFVEKLRACQNGGILQVIRPAREGEKNGLARNKRYDDRHCYLAEYFYSRGERINFYQIWNKVRLVCEDQGMDTPSESWIKQYLLQPAVRNACMERRRGSRYYAQHLGAYTDRTMAASPGEAWMEDGTKLMANYLTADGKVSAKWIYVVLDVYSGYVLGYALADTEDRYLRMRALHMALQTAGYAPAELIHDGHSHGTTDEVKRMEATLEKAGTLITTAPPGQAQYKAQVERWFETFQSTTLKGTANAIGEGVLTKREDGRANPDYLEKLIRDKRLPGEQGLMKQVAELVAVYNQTQYRKRAAPIEKHAQRERPHTKEFGALEMAEAFWHARTVEMRRSEIRLIIQHTTYKYRLTGEGVNELYARYNGTKLRVHYDPANPADTVYLFDPETDMFVAEAIPKTRVNGNRATQSEADKQELGKQHAIKEAQREHLHQQLDQRKEAAAAQGLEVEVLEDYMDYRLANKDALASAETKRIMEYQRQHEGLDDAEANEEIEALAPVPIDAQTDRRPSRPTRSQRRGLYYQEGDLSEVKSNNND